MSDKPTPNTIAAGARLSTTELNHNFDILATAIEACLGRGGTSESPNSMQGDLDMNLYKILNVYTDPDDENSLLTVGGADAIFINESGDTMTGPLYVQEPTSATEPAQKGQLDVEINKRIGADSTLQSNIDTVEKDYKDADSNLQSQISGGAPLEASAFSPISWHDQTIENSVTIPDNKNGWSFGPEITIAASATVTIGLGSYWTIADGEVIV